MAGAANLSHRKTEKLLTKSIKHVLSSSDINTSTRSGNKELGILVRQIAIAPFDSEAAVEKVGTALGEKIATLSKANNKQDLDAGTIRTLSLKKDWIAEFDIPEAAPAEKVSKKASKSAQTVVIEPKKKAEPAKPAPEPAPEAKTEESTAVEEPEAATEPIDEPVAEEQALEEPTAEPEAVEAEATEAKAPASDVPEATEPEPAEPKPAEQEAAEPAAEPEVTEAAAEEAPEAAVPEEATEVAEAAEAEVVETVADAAGEGASTAAPADPEAVAMVNEAATEEE
ncbi:MAG: hypothetical protein AAFQ74_17870 [Cyanobacteria bacterium J06623_4]